jgi:hypothetical protein
MIGDDRLPPEPSWPTVIATTLRLWLQRHVLPARSHGPGRIRRTRRERTVMLSFLLVLILASAATTAFVATEANQPGRHNSASGDPAGHRDTAGSTVARSPVAHSAAGQPQSATSTTGSGAALADAAASRQRAASWVSAQVSRGVIVACDPLMCSALEQQGFPAADLSAITDSSGDPLGSAVVVATTAVRDQLGPRLATVYAPVILASFASGADLVQVRATEVGGASAFLAALSTDVRERTAAGRELAGNAAITAPAVARAQLSGGRVDARILITLAALTHRFRVQVVSFGDSGPGASAGVPLRELTVLAPSPAYLGQLLSFLHAQRPPLLPVVSTHHVGAATDVQIEFTAPSPTGLLGAGVSP